MCCTVLEADGFSSGSPLFRCYVAVCNDKIIGHAVYYYIYYTLERKAIHLEDLFVAVEYRKKFVGSRLFHAVAEVKLFTILYNFQWTGQ